MSNKKYRFQVIEDLISTQEIASQEELLKKLIALEIQVTQATLSRDLKELKIIKVPTENGGYRYQIPENEKNQQNALISSQVSIQFSGHLAVLKSKPGYATSIAFEIDNHSFTTIIGTVAGDDTILLILRESAERRMVIKELQTIIPNIKNIF